MHITWGDTVIHGCVCVFVAEKYVCCDALTAHEHVDSFLFLLIFVMFKQQKNLTNRTDWAGSAFVVFCVYHHGAVKKSGNIFAESLILIFIVLFVIVKPFLIVYDARCTPPVLTWEQRLTSPAADTDGDKGTWKAISPSLFDLIHCLEVPLCILVVIMFSQRT